MARYKTGDEIGKLPEVSSPKDALQHILDITRDKRGHVLWKDHIEWLELKLEAIQKIAERGMKAKK